MSISRKNIFEEEHYMKVKISKRAGEKKSELSQLRHKKHVPGVIYGKGRPSETITVDGEDFDTALRQMKKGHLSTTLFELDLDGKVIKAIAKDIQYHPVTYRILHVDFVELQENQPVNVNIPVDFIGVADCVGIKLGGFLRQVIRHVRVRCLPKDIPSQFELDVSQMGIKQSKRVSDIAMPAAVRSLIGEKNVVVTIAKR
ncbi:MAG TPA: 50S ribosomal protein L25/general stress protein Ctc [Chlamydiales bacterium]|nr:50S ribosomal protein L25/general stress protein Ctc [Chlamydiales bacterium]